jgi:predicted DNA-binding protein with PD1-like motif
MIRLLTLALAACVTLPAADAPDVATFSLPIARVVVVRLKNGTDMLDGLRQAVAREKIKNAVIMSGFGSVTSYHVHVVDNTTFPPKDVFTSEQGPFDLLAIGGLVLDGRVHAHITLRSTKQTTGGHLEKGTSVFTFAAISLGVLSDSTDLSHVDDWTWH